MTFQAQIKPATLRSDAAAAERFLGWFAERGAES